jgi:glycosyltransferase involved in cell wall biosynthesis
MNTALVSIITPAYNCEKYIRETIESVLNQSYINWEIIIVNDYSTDNTLDIIRKFAALDDRIKYITNKKNLGAASSRNVATKAAKGDYIAFLDSDDIWYPKKLEKQISDMKEHKILLSYSAYEVIDAAGEITASHPVAHRITYATLLKKPSAIGTLTMIYDAKRLGKFYFDRTGHEDFAVKLQILRKIPFAGGIIEPLAAYRRHDEVCPATR